MFSRSFLEELFRPQALYRSKEARAVFDRLAHSSIMKLNNTSMDKLMDLMTMGVKHQVLTANGPASILQITLTHLEAMRAATDDVRVTALVSEALSRCVDTYARLPVGELCALRRALARFFQDRRVKVSVFLEEGLQTPDGTLVLRFDGPVPAGTEVPGAIRHFDPSSPTPDKPLPTTDRVAGLRTLGAVLVAEGNALDPATRQCKLGDNMYLKPRPGKEVKGDGAGGGGGGKTGGGEDAGAGTAGPSSLVSGLKSLLGSPSSGDRKGDDDGGDDGDGDGASEEKGGSGSGSAARGASARKTGVASVNLLASLLGAGDSAGGGGGGGFQLSLFADDGTGLAGSSSSAVLAAGGGGGRGGGGGGMGGGAEAGNVLKFASGSDAGSAAAMMARLGLGDEGGGNGSRGRGAGEGKEGGRGGGGGKEDEGGDGEDGQDLLDLLDQM
jgi:hypothetical protein